MAKDKVFTLSPTQAAFVHSPAEICLFIGPMGEGKTHAGVIGLIAHAARCGRPIRAALIRDTHQNMKTSTVPSLQEILGPLVTFHDDHKKMVIHSTPKIEADLFGVDDQASLSKLQGPEYACIWLEEPAPIVEKSNAGIAREVFDLAVARAARQTGTKMRVQITQNPADEDHWTEELAQSPDVYAEDPDSGVQIIKKTFRIPYGENSFLNPHTRIANKAAFKDDPGKYARYVLGKAAPVLKGKKVCVGYNPEIHFSERELEVIPGALGIRGWDCWHHPVCVIGQWLPPGRLIIHNAYAGENIGIRELIGEQVQPALNSPKFRDKLHDWRDIGDPTARTPDQSSVTQTTAKVLEKLLGTRFEPGPTRWAQRIDPTNTALRELATDGQPKIYLSRSAYNLHKALNGGWHWKTDNQGGIIGNLPVKDRFADLGDAFSYAVSILFAYGQRTKKKAGASAAEKQRRMALAMSYASSQGIRQSSRSQR